MRLIGVILVLLGLACLLSPFGVVVWLLGLQGLLIALGLCAFASIAWTVGSMFMAMGVVALDE